MKVIASILVLYFGLLIVQPFTNMCASAKACSTDKCCKSQSHHKKAACDTQANCNTDFCNPFVPCGVSVASRSVQFEFGKPVILELSLIKKLAVNDHITSNYLSDCWRPPCLS